MNINLVCTWRISELGERIEDIWWKWVYCRICD